ncbi:MAG: DUF2147 domain-containing protein [Pseudomonadales bacterium]
MNFCNTGSGRLRGWLVLGAALLSSASLSRVAYAADPALVFGLWAGPSSILEVFESTPGHVQARVVALKNPLFREGEDGPVGEPVVDVNNPDEDLRSRPVLGMELLQEYQRKGKKWQGKIYDPESGKLYSSNMRVNDDGELLMRGYIGAPMFGRTATFVPIQRCTALIKRMLKSALLPGCEPGNSTAR